MKQTFSPIESADRFGANHYAPLPVVITQGRGAWVKDSDGHDYLDCISAYSSLNQGHCHPQIVRALQAQANKLSLTSRAIHNDRYGPFLQKLCELSQFDKALPMNTGAEAVETAIKLSRKWGYEVRGVRPEHARIVVCRDNFHGRTTTIVGFSTESQYRNNFGPFDGGFDIVPFDDLDALDAAITDDTVAFLLEPIQAEAGIKVPGDGYLTAARELCHRRGILFMLDEIQTGLGRTGRMFAFQHESNAKPDVLILGKALGGGLYPVSAVLASKDVMGIFLPGDHGSTFGGNPLACAVAEASLDVIVDEKLTERAARLGAHLFSGISELASPSIAAIRGKGLLIGVEFAPDAGTARHWAEALLAHGVLAKDTHRQVLRLAPPLVTAATDIDWLLERLRRVLSADARPPCPR